MGAGVKSGKPARRGRAFKEQQLPSDWREAFWDAASLLRHSKTQKSLSCLWGVPPTSPPPASPLPCPQSVCSWARSQGAGWQTSSLQGRPPPPGITWEETNYQTGTEFRKGAGPPLVPGRVTHLEGCPSQRPVPFRAAKEEGDGGREGGRERRAAECGQASLQRVRSGGGGGGCSWSPLCPKATGSFPEGPHNTVRGSIPAGKPWKRQGGR